MAVISSTQAIALGGSGRYLFGVKMTWNYRIIKYKDGSGFGLHEVFYDKSVRPSAMTQDSISFVVDNEEGAPVLIKSLCMALTDALTRPIFEEPEQWLGETI